MSDSSDSNIHSAENIAHRFNDEVARNGFKAKSLSRDIGAHENTLGNYVRGKVPDQWVYLARLHEKGIDIRYVLLGIDPDFAGLTSEESLLLKAYRQISPEGQEALLGLAKAYAKDGEKNAMVQSQYMEPLDYDFDLPSIKIKTDDDEKSSA